MLVGIWLIKSKIMSFCGVGQVNTNNDKHALFYLLIKFLFNVCIWQFVSDILFLLLNWLSTKNRPHSQKTLWESLTLAFQITPWERICVWIRVWICVHSFFARKNMEKGMRVQDNFYVTVSKTEYIIWNIYWSFWNRNRQPFQFGELAMDLWDSFWLGSSSLKLVEICVWKIFASFSLEQGTPRIF